MQNYYEAPRITPRHFACQAFLFWPSIFLRAAGENLHVLGRLLGAHRPWARGQPGASRPLPSKRELATFSSRSAFGCCANDATICLSELLRDLLDGPLPIPIAQSSPISSPT